MSTVRALLRDKFSRDLLWNVAGLGIAGVGGVAVNWLVGNVYGAAALGVFNQVFALYIVCSQLAVLGVHGSVLAHMAAAPAPAERRAILVAALAVTVAVATLMAGVFVVAGPAAAALLDSPAVAEAVVWAAPGIVCFALNKVTLSALNALARMRAYAVFQAGRVLFMAAGLVGCMVLHARSTMLPVVLSISELITLGLSLLTLADQLGPVPWARLLGWARTHLRFGVRGFLSGLFGELNTRIDVIILGAFVSDAVVGAYSLAALVAEGLLQVLVALRANYAPSAVKLLAEQRLDELGQRIRRGRNRSYGGALVVGSLSVLGYALVIPQVTRDPQLARSWTFFAVIVAGMVASAGYVPFNQLLLWARRPGWHTVMIGLTATFAALLTLALVAAMGAMGAALATALAYVASVLLVRWFSARVLHLRI